MGSHFNIAPLSAKLGAGKFRLLLALVVMVHHTVGFFGFGAIAVYLFFSLSGFWIARMLGNVDLRKPRNIMLFWLNRWWRIFPLLFAVILITHLISGYRFGAPFAPQNFGSFHWWATLLPIIGITSLGGSVPVIWSLDVEAQFYFLYPLIALCLGRLGRSTKLMVLFLCLSVVYGIYRLASGSPSTTPNVAIFSTFFIGGALYYHHPNLFSQKLVWGGVFLFILGVLAALIHPEYRNILTNYSEFRAAHLLVTQSVFMFVGGLSLLPFALNTTKFGSGLDRSIGELAYPLYLFHYIPTATYVITDFPDTKTKIFYLLLTWSISVAGSLILFFVIDRPSESLRKRFASRRG